MARRDFEGRSAGLNVACLQAALGRLLGRVDWSSIGFRDDCTWTPRMLVSMALLWAWSDELTLVERFHSTRKIICRLFPRQSQPALSYQAFTKLLGRWSARLLALLQVAFRQQGQQELPSFWHVFGWTLFAVDGSRLELPRTRSHEAVYGVARAKTKRRKRARRASTKKSSGPQLWLTTLWHVGWGLPWDWRVGPADSSERAHLLEMLPGLPSGSLIAADAGFVGYHCLSQMLADGRQLLLRVGSNVRLLKQLGYARESDGTVYLWPDREARRHQPPLVLRLVVAHRGKHPVYLLTSVLQASRLSDRQVVELYARRWGIEVFYRSLKQTFQKRKLRSGSADNARLEIDWSLVALWAMALYALLEFGPQGTSPRRLSVACVLRAFRRTIRDYLHPREQGGSLRERLRRAKIDDYLRSNKSSRNYPRKKQERPPGPPKIFTASRSQILQAQRIPQKRLTA
jgi:IS4 transposase